jgi:hypothetical protein
VPLAIQLGMSAEPSDAKMAFALSAAEAGGLTRPLVCLFAFGPAPPEHAVASSVSATQRAAILNRFTLQRYQDMLSSRGFGGFLICQHMR